jgi:LacI family transcriptional regulator
MNKLKNITLTLAWELQLSHEIAKGFMQYARTKPDWECNCPPLYLAREKIGNWTDMDGVVMPGDVRPYCSKLLERGVPLVAAHWLPDAPEIWQANIDPHLVGAFAADHLLRGSYRRLAAVCRLPYNTQMAYAESFTKHCREKGADCETFIAGGRTQEALFDSLLEWIRGGDLPAALFCSSDQTARQLIRMLKEENLHVPDDVAILGCENDIKTCEGSIPAISSVQLPYHRIGLECARLLDAQLKNIDLDTRQVYLPPESIVVRKSTSLFATRDQQVSRAVEYIRRHACENIRIKDVARHAGLTVDTLQRRFKKEVGHGPNAEIQHMRIETVKELLRDTELTLDEIAEANGFSDGHYLSKFFKIKTGLTARKYRNTYHQKKM